LGLETTAPPVTAPRNPFDALRYGLRALEEISRAEASVLAPPRVEAPAFAPHPVVRTPPRDGAALSLRLFSDGPDDATAFVLRDADALTLAPVPARAAPLFEAHAASLARGDDDELAVGFPLVSFVQSGQRRTAPLFFWSGARAQWRLGESAWRLPHGARPGTALEVPTGLALRAPEPDDDEPAFGLHAGLWRQLLDVDAAALAALALAGRAGPGALVRAAVQTLTRGPDEADEAPAVDDAPLARDDLRALVDAVRARASARLSLQAHPHGLVMLLPRGDPTSGLRAELATLLAAKAPRTGPLAVFLGATPAAPQGAPLWTHGASTPTASQVAAAVAFEGSTDLVALCGPPGCGKTTLLHHLAAQAIVARALDETWAKPPAPSTPWGLVVTSTNNAAVDHALAPFVASRALPVGLRVGNRRTLAENTAAALRAAVDALMTLGGPPLPEARAAFEALASPAREHLRLLAAKRPAQERHARETERLTARAGELRALLAAPCLALDVDEDVTPARVHDARESLEAHAHAATLLEAKHLRGDSPTPARAVSQWTKANANRGKAIRKVLEQCGVEVPFRNLREGEDLVAALDEQRAAMTRTLDRLDEVERGLRASTWRRELARVESELGALAPPDDVAATAPPPDPALVEAALAVRDAWARAHRAQLLPRLVEALDIVTEERFVARSRGLAEALAGVSALFPVAGCTLLSLRGSFALDPGAIDRLVIDEAGQCAPVYTVPALARARRALVTGDVAQLPPVYTLDDRVDARLARGLDDDATAPFRMGASATTSAQAVAERRAAEPRSLVEHFRSQPAIVALASSWSGYTLDVRTPPRSLAGVSRRLSRPVIVVDVRGDGRRAPDGVVNEAEAARAVAAVAALVADGVDPRDVAVLTPFVGQSARIERMLLALGLVHDRGVLVRTVHKLQGGERRVVVFSVTATEPKHLRWLAARPHLLHVATSRAQDHLVVFLDAERARGEALLGPLIALAK
jgi:energy-coupling factor transporter ATP-binding protein EcfA2